MSPCKDLTLSISSSIKNKDSVNVDKASQFNNDGYDIYNESDDFYVDICSPASDNGNDITLSDRKKYYYPSNVSICNEGCTYNNINFETNRFECECDIVKEQVEENILIEEEIKKENYLEYFLSLINYKVIFCYRLFSNIKNYIIIKIINTYILK